jgi:phosphoglycerate dehydrogenase-like enzyme
MKETIYKIRSGLCKTKWERNDKVKVLIETNNYFNKMNWDSILKKNKYSNRYEFRYFSNKYEGFKLVKDADILFSFGDNRYYYKDKIKMQYYGISQPDVSNTATAKTYYAKGFSSQSIAEYCLTYTLIMINGYGSYFRNQFHKIWKQNIYDRITSNKISDRVIGVLGLGSNGRKVSEIFRNLGCKVYGYDKENENSDIVNVFCNSFEELLKVSDILIVTVALTPETKNLFNLDSLSKMKKDSYLINVSRGGVINENDLYKILIENKIAGAVLDVTVNEPLPRYNKLWTLDNLIITPHISGNINRHCMEVMTDFSEKLNIFMENRHV